MAHGPLGTRINGFAHCFAAEKPYDRINLFRVCGQSHHGVRPDSAHGGSVILDLPNTRATNRARPTRRHDRDKSEPI